MQQTVYAIKELPRQPLAGLMVVLGSTLGIVQWSERPAD
jgi:hypothetical protein